MEFITRFASGAWGTFAQMSPYLLFGFLVAGFLSVLVPASLVERHLGGAGLWPVVKASLFGVPLPLCSCGVIPVAASLRKHGASKGATTAFLLSTPQTGVDSILVTYSLLGPAMAIFRPIAAFVSGLVGGAAVVALDKDETREMAAQCEAACCAKTPKKGKFASAIEYGLVVLPKDIGRALLVGVGIAALIGALMPADSLTGKFGTGITGMLVMMAVGIPMYVCATASVPIAAALVAKGASAGVALVFLMTGPATNAATIATIWRTMGRRTAVIYLLSVAITSLAAGLIVDTVPAIKIGTASFHAHSAGGSAVETVAAFVLLGVLAYAIWPKAGEGEVPDTGRMTTVLAISGMTCSHCTSAVERALAECRGVESVHVTLKPGTAAVTGDSVDETQLKGKVEELGYKVESIGKRTDVASRLKPE